MVNDKLAQVVDSIRNGNHEDAQQAFSAYAEEKTREILKKEFEPEVSSDENETED
jgi:hypothetical protein